MWCGKDHEQYILPTHPQRAEEQSAGVAFRVPESPVRRHVNCRPAFHASPGPAPSETDSVTNGLMETAILPRRPRDRAGTTGFCTSSLAGRHTVVAQQEPQQAAYQTLDQFDQPLTLSKAIEGAS